MLVLGAARLVFLANPKTATQSVRAMLRNHALDGAWSHDPATRHMGILPFQRKWRALIEAQLGGRVETFAVVREPLARLDSWYRYRLQNPAGDSRSTQGMDFAAFLRAVMSDPRPDMAKVGAQDRFVGWDGQRAAVDVLFDYDRLDLLQAFVADRVGQRLHLPKKNISPPGTDERAGLPGDLVAALRARLAAEFALHAKVAETGVLFGDD